MKTLGIVGGIGPESTIDYYRSILALHHERDPLAPSPPILITSLDVGRALELLGGNRLDALAEWFGGEVERLVRAGADFGVLAANTAHIVFDRLQERSPIPLLSLIEATAVAVEGAGLKRALLLGTRFTMSGSFYPEVFGRHGLELVTPDSNEQNAIHQIYVGELLKNQFLPASRDRILEIIGAVCARSGAQGVILGGTELPLLLRGNEPAGLPCFDTTQIHVERIVDEWTRAE